MSICSIARRTAFKYASEVIQTWFWLPEYEFRVNGVYSEFALTELKRRKALGTLDNYRDVVHRENADKLQPPRPERQPDVTVETLGVSPLALFKPEVLALYNQSQQPQNSLSTKAETKLYFTPGDYSNRYQSTEMMVANQAGKEVNFANELLAKFAEMTADNQAWNQAESQKQDVQQRDAAVRGMQRALNEFLNENTAYRGLKHQLETGQITPEQVLTMLMQFQGKGQSPDSSSVSS
ncbi:MAG TPA: hypothetical protein V6C85_39085 [Allocoleopsis sp.]